MGRVSCFGSLRAELHKPNAKLLSPHICLPFLPAPASPLHMDTAHGQQAGWAPHQDGALESHGHPMSPGIWRTPQRAPHPQIWHRDAVAERGRSHTSVLGFKTLASILAPLENQDSPSPLAPWMRDNTERFNQPKGLGRNHSPHKGSASILDISLVELKTRFTLSRARPFIYRARWQPMCGRHQRGHVGSKSWDLFCWVLG